MQWKAGTLGDLSLYDGEDVWMQWKVYAKHPKTTSKYWADVGYFSDGTAKN